MHVRVSQHAHVLDVRRVHENEVGETTIDQPRCRVGRGGRFSGDGLLFTKLHGRYELDVVMEWRLARVS
jgi:hypothetical protein